jgi:hypothetical protein
MRKLNENSSLRNREREWFSSHETQQDFLNFYDTSRTLGFEGNHYYQQESFEDDLFDNDSDSYSYSYDSEDYVSFTDSMLNYVTYDEYDSSDDYYNSDEFNGYEQYNSEAFAVLDCDIRHLNKRVVEGSMMDYWGISKETNDFDAVRVALKLIGKDLVPSGKYTDSERSHYRLTDVLCSFFEVSECHTLKVKRDCLLLYSNYGGERASTDFDAFCEIISDFIDGNDERTKVDIVDITLNQDKYQDFDFVDFVKARAGMDLSSYSSLLPYELDKSVWSQEVSTLSRFMEQVGDSVIMHYAIMNYMPMQVDVYDWSRLRGKIVSNKNLAVNAIVSNWHAFFSMQGHNYIGHLADLFETVLGIVYRKTNSMGKAFSFLDTMKFQAYYGADGSGNSDKLLKVVTKSAHLGRRCLYKYPNLLVHLDDEQVKVYDIPIDPIDCQRHSLIKSGIRDIRELRMMKARSKVFESQDSRSRFDSNFSQVNRAYHLQMGSKKGSDVFDKPKRRSKKSEYSGSISSSYEPLDSQEDFSDLFGNSEGLEYVCSVSDSEDCNFESDSGGDNFVEVDYRTQSAKLDPDFNYVAVLNEAIQKYRASPLVQSFDRDPNSPAHIPTFTVTIKVFFDNELEVRVLDAPSKNKGRRVAAGVIYDRVVKNLLF